MEHHYRCEDYYEVGREKIREFAYAIQNPHPTHWDDAAAHALGYPGLLAPATFASSVATTAQRAMFQQATPGYEPSQLLHLEQEIHCHRPVVAGDKLFWDLTVDSLRPVAGGDIFVVTTVISDQNSHPVQTVHTTLVGRRATNPEAAQAVSRQILDAPVPRVQLVPGPFSLPPFKSQTLTAGTEIVVGQRFPSRTYQLARGDLVNYAGVSGDNNPIHWNDTASRHAGLDTVVAHGMLTMGLGAGYLTCHLENPGCLTEYVVQFSTLATVDTAKPTDLEFTATVTSIDPTTRTATIALTSESRGRPTFTRATAKVRLH